MTCPSVDSQVFPCLSCQTPVFWPNTVRSPSFAHQAVSGEPGGARKASRAILEIIPLRPFHIYIYIRYYTVVF